MSVKKFFTLLKKNLLISVLLIVLFALVCRLFLNRSVIPTFSASKEAISVPCIMYHHISSDSSKGSKYVITPQVLEQDLKYIKEQGFTPVLMEELISYTEEFFSTLPEKPILITFDDGYYSNYVYAYPLLQKYNMKAVISIIGKQTNEIAYSGKQNVKYSHLNWEQAKEMVESGLVEIQNHSYDMHEKSGKRVGVRKGRYESVSDYEHALEGDVLRLQDLMQEKLGYTPSTFAYPFGEFSKESDDIMKSFGFKVVYRASEGMNRIEKGMGFMVIKRFNRPYGESTEHFFKRLISKM